MVPASVLLCAALHLWLHQPWSQLLPAAMALPLLRVTLQRGNCCKAYIQTFFLTSYLENMPTYYLTFDPATIMQSYLVCYLTFYLACYLAFHQVYQTVYQTVYLAFYLAYILTFYLIPSDLSERYADIQPLTVKIWQSSGPFCLFFPHPAALGEQLT